MEVSRAALEARDGSESAENMSVLTVRDMTRDRRIERMKSDFIATVSHELKTPLTNIRMYAELLDQDLAGRDEQAEQHLRVIVDESQRLSRLIGNVLTFGRKQRGALKLHRKSGVVDDVLRAQMVCAICWEHGLNPPDEIKELII